MKHLKKITIEEISKLANVSAGTVDRALHNRGSISKKTKEKILRIAQEQGYTPNRIGKILSKKKNINIGVITFGENNPYIKGIKEGVQSAFEDYRDFGLSIIVRSMKFLSSTEQVNIIHEFLDKKIDGISLMAIDNAKVRQAVDAAISQNIPVVTFNNDLIGSKRICFVGQEYFRSGQIAADLLCRFIGSKGEIFIVHGSHLLAGHEERLAGFKSVIKNEYPDINISAIEESLDNDDIAFDITVKALSNRGAIKGIYIVAAGYGGVGRAVKKLGIGNKIKVVCNDLVPEVVDLIKEGIFDATIFQDPFMQGKLPIKILFNYLFEGTLPENEFYRTKLEIYTKHFLE